MSKAGFSIADLQHGAKKLNTVDAPAERSQAKAVALNEDEVRALEDLYAKHNGDLDAIFGELGADPSKAKKPHHRPKNANHFAVNYLQGFYSLVDDADLVADSKSSHK